MVFIGQLQFYQWAEDLDLINQLAMRMEVANDDFEWLDTYPEQEMSSLHLWKKDLVTQFGH
jgi:hypothetical protein